MDVVAHNVANVSTVTDERQAGCQHDPTSPQADAEGYVTTPVVELATQMSDLTLANRTYQLNLETIESRESREAYQASPRIGQRGHGPCTHPPDRAPSPLAPRPRRPARRSTT